MLDFGVKIDWCNVIQEHFEFEIKMSLEHLIEKIKVKYKKSTHQFY